MSLSFSCNIISITLTVVIINIVIIITITTIIIFAIIENIDYNDICILINKT